MVHKKNTLVRQLDPPSKWPRWTGFRGMTLRDWLPIVGALLIPVVIAQVPRAITWQQGRIEDKRAKQQGKIEDRRAKAERELARRNAQDEALQAYLEQMGRLMLEGNLSDSKEGSEVRTLAQARTQTLLARLDGRCRGSVVEFLYEASLIHKKDPVVSLSGVRLGDADLSSLVLTKADLSGAYLNRAELRITDLKGANLQDAHLDRADLGVPS